MAHEAAHPRPSARRPSRAKSSPRPSHLRLVHVAPAQDLQSDRPHGRDVYCPPAPAGSLVHLTFRRLFWGAAFPVLVAPPETESVR